MSVDISETFWNSSVSRFRRSLNLQSLPHRHCACPGCDAHSGLQCGATGFASTFSKITANRAVRVEHTRVLVNMIAGITPIVRSVHFQWKHNSLSAPVLTELFFICVPNALPGTVRALVVSIIQNIVWCKKSATSRFVRRSLHSMRNCLSKPISVHAPMSTACQPRPMF